MSLRTCTVAGRTRAGSTVKAPLEYLGGTMYAAIRRFSTDGDMDEALRRADV